MGLFQTIASQFGIGARGRARGERRLSVRVPVQIPVRVQRDNTDPATQCLAVDVSAGGLLAAPHLSGSTGERVMIGVDGRAGLVEAVIAGQRPVGTALVFIDGEQGRCLADWLERRARGGDVVGKP
ncbi:MAG: PilZ domain-containing protein [Pseudomonadota bacterium]|nr:PilZ domain-containing protein [Pseudomonadota bacterium]